MDKSVDPNSIPNKMFIPLKNEISKPLTDIFNLSFLSGVFSSLLKVTKVVPIKKKDSKLDHGSYRLISLQSNIDKIIEILKAL